MQDTVKKAFLCLQDTYQEDLYQFLNRFRDWLNEHLVNYELYLEDEWFEDKTTIDYILRSLDTLNDVILAQDEYLNNRDEKGVWHLGTYQKTRWLVEEPLQVMKTFFQANTPIRLAMPEKV